MIAFRFLAAFASLAAVIALPTPVVDISGNALANGNSIHGIANGNSINLDTRDAAIAAPATPAVPAVPAVPGLSGLIGPDTSKVGSVEVNVQVLNIIKLDLKVSVDSLVAQIRAILADTTITVQDKVAKLVTLVLALAACLTGVIAKVVALAVAKALGLVSGTTEELTSTINSVITLILTALCEICTILGADLGAVTGPVQNVLSLVNSLVICILKIVPIPNLSVAAILATIPNAAALPSVPGIN